MGTMTVQMTGFTIFPTAVNKSYGTFSDADLQSILTWVKGTQNALIQRMFNPSGTPGFVPSDTQLFQAWVQMWINQSIAAQNATATPAPIPPPPVVIGP